MPEKALLREDRLFHLDWLRILAMASVFLFHSGRAFDAIPWHVKVGDPSFGFTLFTIALSQWLMPVFFMISGWTSFMVLQNMTAVRFVQSRAKRLMVPFIFGVFVLTPPQVYIERKTGSGMPDNFLEWFPRYFDGFYGFGGNFGWMGLHLWYLGLLFVIVLVTLPILIYLRAPSPQKEPGQTFLLAAGGLAILASELFVGLFPESIGRQDFGGWSPVTYVIWFLLGFIAGRSQALQLAIVSLRFPALGLMVVGLLAGLGLVGSDQIDFGYFGNMAVRTAVAYGGVIAAFGFAARFLNRKTGWLETGNRYLLAFYVLHQTVIVLIIYLILPFDLSTLAMFACTVALSLAGIVAIIVLIVRPIPFLQPLLGLSANRKLRHQ